MSKVTKIVFRMIRGKVSAVPFKADEMAVNGLHFEQKTLNNYRAALNGFKDFRTNQFKRAEMYRPGGVKDPVRMAEDAAAYDAHRTKNLRDSIMSHYPKDDISQAKGKKSADKAQSLVKGITGIFKGPELGDQVRHFTKQEVTKLAGKSPTKEQFLEHLNDSNKIDVGDAFEVLGKREQGASGKFNAMSVRLSARKRDAMSIMRSANAAAKIQGAGPDKIHKVVNARGKGVTFRRIGGRIVPIRNK